MPASRQTFYIHPIGEPKPSIFFRKREIMRVSGGWDTFAGESTHVLDPSPIGEPKPTIFLQKRVIVRVSGGWDTFAGESTYVLDPPPIGEQQP